MGNNDSQEIHNKIKSCCDIYCGRLNKILDKLTVNDEKGHDKLYNHFRLLHKIFIGLHVTYIKKEFIYKFNYGNEYLGTLNIVYSLNAMWIEKKIYLPVLTPMKYPLIVTQMLNVSDLIYQLIKYEDINQLTAIEKLILETE
jgi:hypothetical protein